MTCFAGRLARLALVAWAVAVLGASSGTALAESFPARTVKIIVGQGAGTTSDILARIVGPKLSALWGQPVVVEGHSGAAGTIAAAMVAKAPADGHTLLLASPANLALAAVQVENLSYDPIRDFAPIGRIAKIPWVLAVNARLPARTVAELVAYAKANPGRLNGGSTGSGSAASFGIDMLSRAAEIEILNVPYKTSAANIQALLAGEVDMVFTDLALVAPHATAGTLRLLAAAGSKRLRAFADLPTMAEQGVADVVLEPWYGLVAPAGTPPDILARLVASTSAILRTPDMRQRILDLGYDSIEDTPAEFASAIGADIARFSAVARRAGPKTGP